VDTLSSGLSYNKNDVVLEFFTDEACTDLVATWTETDGYFAVTYADGSNGAHVMTIEMTSQGLSELNSSKAVYSNPEMVNSGFSDCPLRITYQATMGSDNAVVFGDVGNPNDVVLTWKRTNSSYYDTLVDDAQVYTYGIELTKLFSDGKGNFANVEFVIHNDTDNYFVEAELNETEGVYYVTSYVEHEADATHFVPVVPEGTADGNYKVIIKGLEDDSYTVTEVRTDNGYTLLKEDIAVVIDRVGAIVSATVGGKAVNMLEDNGSNNALVPLTVVNARGFDLPETGDNGTMMFTIFSVLTMAGAAVVIILASRKKRNIS
jgi:LPXTG-motif cell wall-anchored protein